MKQSWDLPVCMLSFLTSRISCTHDRSLADQACPVLLRICLRLYPQIDEAGRAEEPLSLAAIAGLLAPSSR